jgi:hypothetical protein
MVALDLPLLVLIIPLAFLVLVVFAAAYADGWRNVHLNLRVHSTRPHAGRIKRTLGYRIGASPMFSRGQFLPYRDGRP